MPETLLTSTARMPSLATPAKPGQPIWKGKGKPAPLVMFHELPPTREKDFFKSISIFSPDLPDSELPAWDLLLPGYGPVRKQMGVGWKQGQ
jgi:hypothetical protein